MNTKKIFFMVIISISALCSLQIQPFWNFTHNFGSFFNSYQIRNFSLYKNIIGAFVFLKSFIEVETNISKHNESFDFNCEENKFDEDPVKEELGKKQFSHDIFKEDLLFQLAYPGDTINTTYNHVFNVSPSGKIRVKIEQDDDIPYHTEDTCNNYKDLEKFVDRVHRAVFTSKSKKTRKKLSGNCIFNGRRYRLTIIKSEDFCYRD